VPRYLISAIQGTIQLFSAAKCRKMDILLQQIAESYLLADSVVIVNGNKNRNENYLIQCSEIEMRIRYYFENGN